MRSVRRSGKDPPGYKGLVTITNGHPAWTGKVRLVENKLSEPLRWVRPSRVFVNSMSDIFHEGFSDCEIDRAGAVMAAAHWHTFQVLTKRSERLALYFRNIEARLEAWLYETQKEVQALTDLGRLFIRHGWPWAGEGMPYPLPNIWWGVSIEDRKHLHRMDDLRTVPAAVRFVSFEPLLEDLGQVNLEGIHWAIIGAESGPGARPFDVRWAYDLIEQCREAAVKCFVKQLGPDPIDGLGKMRGAMVPKNFDRKGGNMDQWPLGLRVREFPEGVGV